ncbi:hypothetical protein [Parendozoicomonas haliclonae]|uniref:Uncharacterized protein n=1 Tax=Parendozoicomonas haliclonae TaxID=1960125 RepID=A0A1X7AJQ7_9GAMM|nr:hypothetical protein [Parendozoicomonas haliclonae]SMA46232.1 hypothetical protein EHSB41UT_02106 [Parendozoicomonas haliclonae]
MVERGRQSFTAAAVLATLLSVAQVAPLWAANNYLPAQDSGSAFTNEPDASYILQSLPVSKNQEFIDRRWSNRDTAFRVLKEEGVRASAIISMAIAGRLALSAGDSVLATYGPVWFRPWIAPVMTLGLQTTADFFSSLSMRDFYMRAGFNAANTILPGDYLAFWRQMGAFLLGHISLANQYWPEVRSQMRYAHEGTQRVRFMSPIMDQQIDLELVATGINIGESAELVMHFSGVTPETLPSTVNELENEWFSLAKACLDHGVTSVRMRPDGKSTKAMYIQLWREGRLLSETRLPVAVDTEVGSIWLTDWLTIKEWQDTLPDHLAVITPFSHSVLQAIKKLVTEGDESSAVVIQRVPHALSPEGHLAVFSTGGSEGYLLVDRNTTQNVELPELWLNTSDAYREDMNIVLAKVEERQEPGHWRGLEGLSVELGRSLITRNFIYAAMNWFLPDPADMDSTPRRGEKRKLRRGRQDDATDQPRKLKSKRGSATKEKSVPASLDENGRLKLPPEVWAEQSDYEGYYDYLPREWKSEGDYSEPITEAEYAKALLKEAVNKKPARRKR